MLPPLPRVLSRAIHQGLARKESQELPTSPARLLKLVSQGDSIAPPDVAPSQWPVLTLRPVWGETVTQFTSFFEKSEPRKHQKKHKIKGAVSVGGQQGVHNGGYLSHLPAKPSITYVPMANSCLAYLNFSRQGKQQRFGSVWGNTQAGTNTVLRATAKTTGRTLGARTMRPWFCVGSSR